MQPEMSSLACGAFGPLQPPPIRPKLQTLLAAAPLNAQLPRRSEGAMPARISAMMRPVLVWPNAIGLPEARFDAFRMLEHFFDFLFGNLVFGCDIRKCSGLCASQGTPEVAAGRGARCGGPTSPCPQGGLPPGAAVGEGRPDPGVQTAGLSKIVARHPESLVRARSLAGPLLSSRQTPRAAW